MKEYTLLKNSLSKTVNFGYTPIFKGQEIPNYFHSYVSFLCTDEYPGTVGFYSTQISQSVTEIWPSEVERTKAPEAKANYQLIIW